MCGNACATTSMRSQSVNEVERHMAPVYQQAIEQVSADLQLASVPLFYLIIIQLLKWCCGFPSFFLWDDYNDNVVDCGENLHLLFFLLYSRT